MILTKPFGQVQRHLKENVKFVFALYIPPLFKKIDAPTTQIAYYLWNMEEM